MAEHPLLQLVKEALIGLLPPKKRRMIQTNLSWYKEKLSLYEDAKSFFILSKAVIFETEEIMVDNDPGNAAVYEFFTKDHVRYTGKLPYSIHWPSKEQWAEMEKETRVGNYIWVLYDPGRPERRVAFFSSENYSARIDEYTQYFRRALNQSLLDHRLSPS